MNVLWRWFRLPYLLLLRPSTVGDTYSIPTNQSGLRTYAVLMAKFVVGMVVTALPIVIRQNGLGVIGLYNYSTFLTETVRVSWSFLIVIVAAIGAQHAITRVLHNSIRLRDTTAMITLGGGVYLSILFVITNFCGLTCAYFGKGVQYVLSRLYGPLDIVIVALFALSFVYFYVAVYGGVLKSKGTTRTTAHVIASATTITIIVTTQMTVGTVRPPYWLFPILRPVI